MTSSSDPVDNEDTFDLVVIGGGVVGLAVLRAATLAEHKCLLVEREADLLSHASGGNSGILCTGVDASEGTLERALIRDSISQVRSFMKSMNVPYRECGSLVCQWEEGSKDALHKVLAESHDAGDTHAKILTKEEVLKLEPHINPSCSGAVHIPGEIVTDPWMFALALACHARQNGAKIVTGFEVDSSQLKFNGDVWEINATAKVECGISKVFARAVVNAAGLWCDVIQGDAHERPASWSARPRRGQYRVFQSSREASLTHPMQPIPTQRTKGIFVFSTLYDQIVVGPTALDQSSRTDRTVDDGVAVELEEYAKKVLPSINEHDVVGNYVGIRPGSDKRDYQIKMDSRRQWIACAGIRSTGKIHRRFLSNLTGVCRTNR